MNAFLTYFRLHPWQRRVMTGLIAAIAGVALAWVLLPFLQDHRLIGRLGSASLRERKQAITDAVYRAGDRPEFVRRLEAASNTRIGYIALRSPKTPKAAPTRPCGSSGSVSLPSAGGIMRTFAGRWLSQRLMGRRPCGPKRHCWRRDWLMT